MASKQVSGEPRTSRKKPASTRASNMVWKFVCGWSPCQSRMSDFTCKQHPHDGNAKQALQRLTGIISRRALHRPLAFLTFAHFHGLRSVIAHTRLHGQVTLMQKLGAKHLAHLKAVARQVRRRVAQAVELVPQDALLPALQ